MDKSIFTVAFDIGGVIFDCSNDCNVFSTNYMDTPLVPGIYDVIKSLSSIANYKLIIISKAYPTNAKKSMEILKMYNLDSFFNSIIFCEDPNDKVKIAMAMNVKIMIDDKQTILDTFKDTDIKTILFKKEEVGGLIYHISASS